MRTASAVAIALVAIAAPTMSHAAELDGAWSGTWTKAGDPLAVTVSFEKAGDGYTGSFDSDALQVAGIPFKEVTVAGTKVHFTLVGDATTTVFDGVLTTNRLTGTFAEGVVAGNFDLKRSIAEAPLVRRDATFANGNVTLAGELILPLSPGGHQAILFMHGSGAEGRWANRYLAHKFARAGFVALIYDKRGVGQSTGDWQQAGFEDLAEDAAAGIRFLASQPEVDPARVGVYGHSQGGTISPMVAERGLAFVVASAASGLDPAEVEIYSVGNSIGIANLPEAERADADRFVRAIVAVAYKDKDRAALDAMAQGFKSRPWYFDPPPPSDPYWAISRKVALYRPLDHWRKVKAPVLLVYGAHDERVPAEKSIVAITSALKAGGNAKITVTIFPNADHAFHIVSQKAPGGWTKREPDYAKALVAWASAR